MNSNVDKFIERSKLWQKEMSQLRSIVLSCGLTETLKWGVPCYTFQDNNILIIHGFKEYCALNFFKGTLLNDTVGILVAQTKNVQAGRQIRFSKVDEIKKLETTIKSYIFQAIEIEKKGLRIEYKKAEDFDLPKELTDKFKESPDFKLAFYKLTPGRQKAYLLYFSGAKGANTRESRIEKYVPKILNGKGLNDCICGMSKKMPQCDGSHKLLEQKK